jgi:drug/metabolite transporter (DMT)-like permease
VQKNRLCAAASPGKIVASVLIRLVTACARIMRKGKKMRADRRLQGAAMLLFTTLVWGAMFAIAKAALGAIDAFWLSTWRYVPASIAMLAMLALVEGRGALRLEGRGLRLWVYGTLGFAGFSVMGYLGLSRSRPEHAAIIVATMPLITAMIAWLVRGRRPGTTTIGAAIAALIGVALVITHGHLHGVFAGTLAADALVLAGAICWIAYTMGAATLPATFSTLRYTALSMAFGTLSIIAVTLVATASGHAHVPHGIVVVSFAREIAFLSIIAGVLAVLAWNGGIAALGAANGVLFINLVPIVAFAIGVAQGHPIARSDIAGVVLVIGALVVNGLAGRAPVARSPKFA